MDCLKEDPDKYNSWITVRYKRIHGICGMELKLDKTIDKWITLATGSSQRCPLCSNSLVHSENNSYFVEIQPLLK